MGTWSTGWGHGDMEYWVGGLAGGGGDGVKTFIHFPVIS